MTLRLELPWVTVTVAAGAAAPRLLNTGVALAAKVMPSGAGMLPAPSVPTPVQTPGVWQFACLVYVIAEAVTPTETEQFSWMASWRPRFTVAATSSAAPRTSALL